MLDWIDYAIAFVIVSALGFAFACGMLTRQWLDRGKR
jgi:hypothetical protein